MYTLAPLISLLACASTIAKAWPQHSFITQPNFTIPAFNISKSGEALAPGYIFITPSSPTIDAALIITDNGTLIWSSNTSYFTNFFVQSFDNRPILTYWEGTGSANVAEQGHGHGLVHILDTHYNEIYTICPDFGLYTVNNTAVVSCQADLHESYVTDRGSILVTAYNATQANLTAVGGAADGWVWNCLFYEIDIKTQKQLFSWSALDAGIPITDSKQPLDGAGTDANPYDWFHINSVQSVGDGYLVNSRNVWTTYRLNSKGKIEWRLEGSTGGDFVLPEAGHFSWEHHARAHNVKPTTLILTLFNNANSAPVLANASQTTGLILFLDLSAKTATLVEKFFDPTEPLYVSTQGAFNILPNDNIFMGYGQLPVVKEYGLAGDTRMTIQFGDLAFSESYRAYRLPWSATPAADPLVVVENGTAFMSWNGATDVTHWDVYEGKTTNDLVQTKSSPSAGFETDVTIAIGTIFVQVAAFHGEKFLRNSSVVAVS